MLIDSQKSLINSYTQPPLVQGRRSMSDIVQQIVSGEMQHQADPMGFQGGCFPPTTTGQTDSTSAIQQVVNVMSQLVGQLIEVVQTLLAKIMPQGQQAQGTDASGSQAGGTTPATGTGSTSATGSTTGTTGSGTTQTPSTTGTTGTTATDAPSDWTGIFKKVGDFLTKIFDLGKKSLPKTVKTYGKRIAKYVGTLAKAFNPGGKLASLASKAAKVFTSIF